MAPLPCPQIPKLEGIFVRLPDLAPATGAHHKMIITTNMPPIATAFNQPGHPPATLTHIKTVRFLHLGTSWVQGAMDLRKPNAIALEYVQIMMCWTLFQTAPRHIVQLGLGSAALTKFCYHEFPAAKITAIELNPNVIAICGAHFNLPPNDARLQVMEMNAQDYVLNPANHNQIDILQVDLYDEAAQGPVLDSLAFYQGCFDSLRPDGILTLNLFGQPAAYDRTMSALAQIFDAVVWLPEVHDANIIVIGFKNAPEIDFSVLYTRAAQIKKEYNLPAKTWVNGLKVWMTEQ